MSEIRLSPFYHSAVNAVTKPNKFTAASHYFIDRWMPLLGGNGTMIVLALRRDGFLNRKTGECRDEIVIDGADLAAAAGISEDTLIREFGTNKKTGKPQNEWLHLFVQKRARKRRNKAGVLRQEENAYWVAMDDPIHPDDWPLVAEAVREAEERREKVGGPGPHNAYPVGGPGPQSPASPPQSAGGKPQSTARQPQSAYHLKTLDSSLPQLTLDDAAPAAPDNSASLFSGEEQKEPDAPAPWSSLSESERAPYRERAEHELAASCTTAKVKPRQRAIDARAEKIYEKGAFAYAPGENGVWA